MSSLLDDSAGSSSGLSWRENQPRPRPSVDHESYWHKREEEEKRQAPKDETKFGIVDVDLFKRNNRFDHETFRYEHEELIVRRGQPFTISVKVNGKFTKGQDVIKLQFVTGIDPRQSCKTMSMITPGDSLDATRGSAVIEHVTMDGDTSTVRLSVALACDAPVGRYSLTVRVRHASAVGFTKKKLSEKIIVLFNAWCKEDHVYMADKDDRDEYVLNQSGQIWVGSAGNNAGRSWVFGQFDKASLDGAMLALDSSSLPYEAYGNPVRVARCLSAMVNSNDGDKGILTGNWSGDYSGGTSPTQWNGSVRILEEYVKTKKQVRFGQCWVFSGVSTTVCRTLGIPARSVTNFQSAHDQDLSMTLDYHFDTDGNPISFMNDSIWNFHVWNEGWFKRPDLPDGNDGWQAFDATPQEASDGVMQCGPAPVAAIKSGNVHFGFDTKFIFAEVNGDSVVWQVNNQEERTVLSVDAEKVGKKISTKAPGKRERLDLTDQYKYCEGTGDERRVAKIVSQLSSRRNELQKYYGCTQKNDVKISFEGLLDNKGDADFVFKAVNDSREERTINARITLVARYYTGVDGEVIGKTNKEIKLSSATEDILSYKLKAADWLNKVAGDATVGVYAYGKVQETGQTFIHRDSYSIDKPSLDIVAKTKKAKVRQALELTISLTNPLDVPLTNNSYMLESAGVKTDKEIVLPGKIEPGQTVSKTVTVTPRMVGKREVIASFHSRQLTGVFGSLEVDVEE